MNMRKIIALLAAVLMLCAAIPMGALSVAAAPGDVIIDKNFDDGNVFSNASAENGYMVFDATTADWANVYLYANAIHSGTKYEITFDAKADKATNLNVKINNNWGGDTFKWTTDVTTEWTTYTCVINPDELATLTSTALLMFTSNATAANGAVYHIDNVVVKEYKDPAQIGKIVNGDFETGNLSGWAAHQSTAISADAAHTGSYGANLKGNGGWGGMLNQDIPVEAGKNYEVSLWYKTISNGVNVQIKDGGTSGNNLASDWVKKTEWTQLTFVVAPTTDIICINFCGGGNGVAEDVYVDDIVVKELIDPSFDGYITNGDFETNSVTPWDVYSGTATSAEAAKSGEYGLKMTGGAGWGGMANQNFTVEAGKTYVIRFDACVVNQGVNVQIKDNGANVGGGYISKQEWTTYTYEFTPNSTNANLNFCGSGTAGGDIVYLDNVMVYEKVEQSNDGYIINGTFETGALTPWVNLWGSCPVAEVVRGGMDSNWALNVVSGQWKHVRQTAIAVEANTDYTITAWVKNAKNMSLLVKDGGDSKDILNVGVNAGEEWTEFTGTFNTGDYTTIIFSLMGGAEEAYGTFDNIVMEKAHVCEYTLTGGEWPTCDLPGYQEYSCECGESYTETLPAYHNGGLEYTPAKDAIDCANPGNIEYYFCPGCYEYFADAEATEYINPWYIEITVDCVRPEGIADCATVTCETCGNEIYGYGEHDVLTCQGGTCSKCNAEIEGVGCANYDTPACEDGVCSYCGAFIAGFGHENGAWAACLDGECSYGCGLKYPATEDHVDADADDYCDNCWNHLACIDEDGDNYCDVCWSLMPHDCIDDDADGMCDICWNEMPVCEHVYFDDCSAICEICGAEREVSHNVVHVEAVAPTCTAMGNIEYWYCDVCGMAWLNAECTQNTNLRAVKLPATGEHVYDDEYDADCNVCGDIREVPEKPVDVIYGDANGDGEVNARDAALLQQMLAGWDVTLSEASADANADGEVNARDAALIQQLLAGWDVTLGPV